MKFFGVFLVICLFRACSSETSTESATGDTDKPVKSPSHIILRLASKKFLICEGFLIANNVAITAAGCVQKYKSIPNNLEVVAGVTSTYNIESEKKIQTRRIAEIIIHPDYSSSKKRNADIALVKVTRPFKLNDNVGIASYGNESAFERIAQLVGYGDNDVKTSIPLKVFSPEDCKTYLNSESKDGKFCVKLRYNNDREDDGFHYGESSYAGAPLYYSDIEETVVCGIAPSTSGAVYMDLAYYAPWIKNNSGVNPIKTPAPTTTAATSSSATPTTTPTTTTDK